MMQSNKSLGKNLCHMLGISKHQTPGLAGEEVRTDYVGNGIVSTSSGNRNTETDHFSPENIMNGIDPARDATSVEKWSRHGHNADEETSSCAGNEAGVSRGYWIEVNAVEGDCAKGKLKQRLSSRWFYLLVVILVGTTAIGFVRMADTPAHRHNDTAFTDKHRKLRYGTETNVFHKIRPYFLVQWGTARIGCRPSPKSPLELACQGGELQIIHDYDDSLDCQHTSPDRALCSLPPSTLESSSGAGWTQGALIASCHKGDSMDIPVEFRDVPLEFRASFDMKYPALCRGVLAVGPGDGLEEMPFGGFGSYLSSSRLCARSPSTIESLPSPQCTASQGIYIETPSHDVATICKADDSCHVPLCPERFDCAGGHSCEVKPRALAVTHDELLPCADHGLQDLEASDDLWAAVQSHVLSVADLEDAGLGVPYS